MIVCTASQVKCRSEMISSCIVSTPAVTLVMLLTGTHVFYLSFRFKNTCHNILMLFRNRWIEPIKPQDQNTGDKILVGIKPNLPLKPIEEAQQKLQVQISKLIPQPTRLRKSSGNL
jgi:hypothetical protein